MVIDADLEINSVEIFDCFLQKKINTMEEMWAEIATLVEEGDEVILFIFKSTSITEYWYS